MDVQDDYRDQFQGHDNMDSNVFTAFKVSSQRQAAAVPSRKDKSDRATVEQALDPRTRMVWSTIFTKLCSRTTSNLQH